MINRINKILIVSILLVVLHHATIAQTFDEKMESIKSSYQKIVDSNPKLMSEWYCDHQAFFLYESDGKVVKAVYQAGESGYSVNTEIYVKCGKIFFVYTQTSEPKEEDADLSSDIDFVVEENRYYFDEGVLIQLISQSCIENEGAKTKTKWDKVVTKPNSKAEIIPFNEHLESIIMNCLFKEQNTEEGYSCHCEE